MSESAIANPKENEELVIDELDESQRDQIKDMIGFDGLPIPTVQDPNAVKPPVAEVPKVETPPVVKEVVPSVEEPPAELPRGREPESVMEETPPAEETPPVGEETPPAETEEERLTKQNAALMKLLNQRAGGVSSPIPSAGTPLTAEPPAAQPEVQQKPGELKQFVTQEKFQEVFSNPEALNEILNEVYNAGRQSAAPTSGLDASTVAKMEIATDKFFTEYPDLEPVRVYVGESAAQLSEAKDAPATFRELLEAAGIETRKLLHMPEPVIVPASDTVSNKGNQKIGGAGNFAPAQGGARGAPFPVVQKTKALEGEAKDINDMIAFAKEH